jgi:hypothetical protein
MDLTDLTDLASLSVSNSFEGLPYLSVLDEYVTGICLCSDIRADTGCDTRVDTKLSSKSSISSTSGVDDFLITMIISS